MHPEIPHLAFPLRAENGVLATVEQDTFDDVRQCIHVITVTPRGSRPLAPDIGVDDPTFTDGFDAEQLAADLEAWEDRASVTVTTSGPDAAGQQQVRVAVALVGDDTFDPEATTA